MDNPLNCMYYMILRGFFSSISIVFPHKYCKVSLWITVTPWTHLQCKVNKAGANPCLVFGFAHFLQRSMTLTLIGPCLISPPSIHQHITIMLGSIRQVQWVRIVSLGAFFVLDWCPKFQLLNLESAKEWVAQTQISVTSLPNTPHRCTLPKS